MALSVYGHSFSGMNKLASRNEYTLDASDYVYSSVTLAAQGVLYFGGADGLYAIHVAPEPSSILLTLLAAGLLLPMRRRRKC